MLLSMDYESSYASGAYSSPQMRVYGGWSSHKSSFARNQPFFNETQDVVLLFSGECFIDSEVKTALVQKGHQLAKNGADWLVHLYEEEGDRFFASLNGLFSGVVIDKRQGRVFLFNDRYGVERIYWHGAGQDFYFASEAKALLEAIPQLREFDHDGVAQFLAFGCTTGTRTMFRSINLLPGGSVWCFDGGDCHKREYFSPKTWESQSRLSNEAFDAAFEQTFKRILPRYFDREFESEIGISLTGGLDTRLIMACGPDSIQDVICYTFSGQTGETLDDRFAARIAKACGLEHRLLRIGRDFFSDFASHVDRTVFVTDGCVGPTGAHEIYFNRQARRLASVRLTGNYGSELFRGISTFKPRRFRPDLFEPEFAKRLSYLSESMPFRNEPRATFTAFREIPLNLIGTLLAARSQVVFRTPYLDNEMVALAYQNPKPLSRSPLTALNVIDRNNHALGKIGSDMGFRANDGPLRAWARYLLHRTTFKLDYIYNEQLPDWLSPLEPVLARVGFGMGILGLHKYLHYQSWFRRELASYLHEVMKQAQTRESVFWNPDSIKRMTEEHTSGRGNYVSEISAVLTLQAVERTLLRGRAGSDQKRHDSLLPILAGAAAEQR
jgi:asparagine synthase (glutamine-hydrolysing)